MRKSLSAVTAMVLLAAPASAQVTDPTVPHDDADTIKPKASYPLGDSEAVARSMLLSMRIAQKQRDLCWELGCLVIVNDSPSYEVTGFFVQMRRKDGSIGWSNNQFGLPLMPKRATFRFKSGGPETCDQPVKFLMRKAKTKDVFSFETRIPLCSQPHKDSLVRIRAVIPEVQVGG